MKNIRSVLLGASIVAFAITVHGSESSKAPQKIYSPEELTNVLPRREAWIVSNGDAEKAREAIHAAILDSKLPKSSPYRKNFDDYALSYAGYIDEQGIKIIVVDAQSDWKENGMPSPSRTTLGLGTVHFHAVYNVASGKVTQLIPNGDR